LTDSAASAAVQERVLAFLNEGEHGARFVSDVARKGALPQPQVEDALAALEGEGRLLVREYYCADPHLEGVDLRIAGAVRQPADGGDAVSSCIQAIDATWQEWITAYLADHRCS
jgi:hypothetical protein